MRKTKHILILTTICCFSLHLLGQSYKENNIGFHVGASVYQNVEPKIPVRAYFGTNIELGFDFTHYYQTDKFIKTGLTYSFFKSPFKNNESYYDEYLQIPVLFSLVKFREFKHHNDLYLTIGPQISILSRQGMALRGEKNYNFDNSHFGGIIKFGITGELALYQKMAKYAHAGGVRFTTDIPKLFIKTNDDITVYDQYITATIFYSISKRQIRKRR